MQKKAWQLKLAEAGLEENPDAAANGGDPFRVSKFGIEQKMRQAQLANIQKAGDVLNEVNKGRAANGLPLLTGDKYRDAFMPQTSDSIKGLLMSGQRQGAGGTVAGGGLVNPIANPSTAAAPTPAMSPRPDTMTLPGGLSPELQAKQLQLVKDQNDIVKQKRELADPYNKANKPSQDLANQHIAAIGTNQTAATKLKGVISQLRDPNLPESIKLDAAQQALSLLQAKEGAGNLKGEALHEASRLLEPYRLTAPDAGFGRNYSRQADVFAGKLKELEEDTNTRKSAIGKILPGYQVPGSGESELAKNSDKMDAGYHPSKPIADPSKMSTASIKARLNFLTEMAKKKGSGKGLMAGGE